MSEPPQPSDQAERCHFGGNDWLTRYPRGQKPAYRVDTPVAKRHWRPRTVETQLSAAHPGSAVVIDNRLLEVYAYKKSQHDPPLHLYYLIDWDENLTPAPPEVFTPEVAERYARQVAETRARQRRSWTLLVLAPLFSLLPRDDQERLALEYDFPAVTVCRMTGAVGLSCAIAAIGWSFWAMVNPIAPELRNILPQLRLFFFLLMTDSAIRLFGSFTGGEPVGSLFVAGPINTFRALRDALSRDQRIEAAQTLRKMQQTAEDRSLLEDQVVPLDRIDDTGRQYLEIRSIIDKPHWTLNRTGVHFAGNWYVPTEREKVAVDSASEPAFRFLLEPLEVGRPTTYTTEYVPSEVATLLYREQVKHRKTWAQTFALFLGLLRSDQLEDLASLYDLEPRRMVRSSAIAQCVIGAVLLWWSLPKVTLGLGVSYLFELGLGLGLVVDGTLRLTALARGLLRGSFLSGVIRFLASPLFDDQAPPGARPAREDSRDTTLEKKTAS